MGCNSGSLRLNEDIHLLSLCVGNDVELECMAFAEGPFVEGKLVFGLGCGDTSEMKEIYLKHFIKT